MGNTKEKIISGRNLEDVELSSKLTIKIEKLIKYYLRETS